MKNDFDSLVTKAFFMKNQRKSRVFGHRRSVLSQKLNVHGASSEDSTLLTVWSKSVSGDPNISIFHQKLWISTTTAISRYQCKTEPTTLFLSQKRKKPLYFVSKKLSLVTFPTFSDVPFGIEGDPQSLITQQ